MGGGGGPTAEKQPQQRFFKPSTDFTVILGGSNIFQGGGGSNISRGGGGGKGPDADFHKNAYNL